VGFLTVRFLHYQIMLQDAVVTHCRHASPATAICGNSRTGVLSALNGATSSASSKTIGIASMMPAIVRSAPARHLSS